MSTKLLISARDLASYGTLPPPVVDLLVDLQRQVESLSDIRSGTILLGANSVTISDNRITTASKAMVSLGSNDTTLKSVSYTVALGSITIRGNANATANCAVNYLLI